MGAMQTLASLNSLLSRDSIFQGCLLPFTENTCLPGGPHIRSSQAVSERSLCHVQPSGVVVLALVGAGSP